MSNPETPAPNTTEPTKPSTPSPSTGQQLGDDDLAKVSGGTSVSNVLKTRHDTAKNSISNIR